MQRKTLWRRICATCALCFMLGIITRKIWMEISRPLHSTMTGMGYHWLSILRFTHLTVHPASWDNCRLIHSVFSNPIPSWGMKSINWNEGYFRYMSWGRHATVANTQCLPSKARYCAVYSFISTCICIVELRLRSKNSCINPEGWVESTNPRDIKYAACQISDERKSRR